MAFGENSWLQGENGRDMLWNPTANIYQTLGVPAMGGMHAIYVFTDSTRIVQDDIDLTYQGDEIKNHPLYSVIGNLSNTISKLNFYNTIAWASIPLLTDDIYEFSSYANIPTETTVSLRVAKPYQRTDNGFAQPLTNDGYPQYGFSSEGRAVDVGVNSIAENALETVRVVPNPYYGSSQYEDSQLDNIVKITNLPQECEISIFMANGTKVRTISKDTELTFVEWDLTNDYDVPIASGVYLIHINAPGIGEKVVKWMGSLRPVDLNAF